MTTIEFSATVNGAQRSVQLDTDHPALAAWSTTWTDGLTQNGEPDQEDLDAIELCVMNESALYFAFYEGATGDDFDAELLDIRAEVI